MLHALEACPLNNAVQNLFLQNYFKMNDRQITTQLYGRWEICRCVLVPCTTFRSNPPRTFWVTCISHTTTSITAVIGFRLTGLFSGDYSASGRVPIDLPKRTFSDCCSGNYLHPPLGVVHPLLTLTHTPKLCSPHWGCVYCSSGVFVHSVGFYALVSWAIPTYSRCWCV